MRKFWLWSAGIVIVALVSIVAYVRFFIDEPLRRTIEQNVNTALKGYTVRIHKLKFHPLDFSLDLFDLDIVQNAHPDPPVARLPRLRAGVHWRSLLRRQLVADFLIDRPTLHINLKQAKSEAQDKIPVTERGWQDALEEIYPLKVNEFRVRDGDITYMDDGPFKPLHLSRVNFRASNIRNIRSRDQVYPSEVYLEGDVFGSGKAIIKGNADFLKKPHAGIKALFMLSQIELDYFKPIIRRYYISVRDGVLSSDGNFEYAPATKNVDLRHITIQGVQLDYIHKAETEKGERELATNVSQAAKQLNNSKEVSVRAEQVNIQKSTFAFVNQAAQPSYRIFLADAEIKLDRLSNQGAEGTAVGTMRGKFMGSGNAWVRIAFRPRAKSPDLDLKIRIQETKMPAMNNLLLAYANFDVEEGLFSFYSEISLRNGEIRGYIKPIVKEIDVYDAEKDGQKPVLSQLREALIGGLAWLFTNRARDEVATTAEIYGKIDDPQFSTWQFVIGFIRNAFFKSILPGFDGQPARDAKS